MATKSGESKIEVATVPIKEDIVVIAILVKDKSHCLPLYLKCIEDQTWPKSKSIIYIRCNNNKDNTKEILIEWAAKVKSQYLDLYINTEDVPERVQDYKTHEWNRLRFKVLGKIRQDSSDYAKSRGAHYFVADCDNFPAPYTIKNLIDTGLQAVAPLLTTNNMYTNIHHRCDSNGYMDLSSKVDRQILYLEVRGLIAVDVIHCTYLYRNDILSKVVYDDGSGRYEYVIVAHSLRKNGIQQYIDNRYDYGRISFADTKEDLEKEPWLDLFPLNSDTKICTEAPNLKILYGSKDGLKMNVTSKIFKNFNVGNVLLFPKETKLHEILGDCRFGALKFLDIYIDDKLILTLPNIITDDSIIPIKKRSV